LIEISSFIMNQREKMKHVCGSIPN